MAEYIKLTAVSNSDLLLFLSLIAASVAAYFYWRQLRAMHLTSLVQYLELRSVRNARRLVMKNKEFIRDRPFEQNDSWDDKLRNAAAEVCASYNLAGHLTKSRLVSRKIVFGHWGISAKRFMDVLETYVEARNATESEEYLEGFRWLADNAPDTKMPQIELKKSADIERRLKVVALLANKAEGKVIHADTFRQRNMNYALVVFAGLTALRVNLAEPAAPYVISATLLILSVVFCIWDRRWHRIKHGWDSTAKKCHECLVALTNNPDQDVSFSDYDAKAEEKAEWTSWQPVVFYLLILGSALSFFVK